MNKILLMTAVFIFAASYSAEAVRTDDCTVCHVSHKGFLLLQPVNELCTNCHRDRVAAGEHAVNVVPKFPVPPELPLAKDGRITCITCHNPHSKEGRMLRLAPVVLCGKCHMK